VKPAGNVAALRENPPPRKSHATRLTQRQSQRREKFWLFDRLLFFIDPDFENFVGLARMLNFFLPRITPRLCQFCQQISTPKAALRSRKTRSAAPLLYENHSLGQIS
jgi:hypothetical protein